MAFQQDSLIQGPSITLKATSAPDLQGNSVALGNKPGKRQAEGKGWHGNK